MLRLNLRPAFRPVRRCAVIIGLLLTAVLVTAAAADSPKYGPLPLMGRGWMPSDPAKVAAEQHRQKVLQERWHQVHELVGGQHISERGRADLLRRGLGPALLDKSAAPGAAKAWAGTDTLKVLIVRISFDNNRDPRLTTVAPDGDFQFEELPVRQDTLYVDPPPHGKAYFESHLEGLGEFYNYQSGGRLHIEGQVLPAGETDSYKLSDPADYGPGADDFWSLEQLELLVRDVMIAADEGTQADGGPRLADYDDDDPLTYIIFVHSGSDWQSDINRDSPNDIPTFFVVLGEAQELTSTDSDSGEFGRLSECSIIPETTNQDGYPGSIAAAFYHEFGHALGLPDVYSTRTALPSVGYWDLMDSGTNLAVPLGFVNDVGDTIATVATGVLPPSIGAWNKWYLGWLETEDVDNFSSYSLPPVGVPRDQYDLYERINVNFDVGDPQALRGGISPREWFLLENRWVPGGPGETPYAHELFLERDDDTGVILYLAGVVSEGAAPVNSGLYDYYLPGGGLLVWHVNMDRIEEGLDDNTINWFGDGLRLVEADGIQDVGYTEGYTLGWAGSFLDPFGGYYYDIYGDRHYTGYRNLYAAGFPNSRCYDRSWTGFTITGVQDEGQNPSILNFAAEVEPLLPNFPWEVADVDSVTPRAVDVRSLTTLTVVDEPILLYADAAPRGWDGGAWPTGLYTLRREGVPRYPTPGGRPIGEFRQLTSPLAGAPVAWTVDDGEGRVVLGTTDGVVTLLAMPTIMPRPVETWAVDMGDTLMAAPLVLRRDDEAAGVVVVHSSAQLGVRDLSDGTSLMLDLDLGTGPFGAVTVTGDLRIVPAATGWDEFIVPTDAGWFRCDVGTGNIELLASAAWASAAVGRVHTAYVAEDGGDVLTFFDDTGLLGSWYLDGSMADARAVVDEALVTEPAVADLNGDGRDDLVFATGRHIHGFQGDGVPVRGYPVALRDLFPLPDSTRIGSPLVVLDVDGDAVNEVLFNTNSGHLFSLDAAGALRGRTPLRWGDHGAAGFAVSEAREAEDGRVMWMASAGGYTARPLPRQLQGGRVGGFKLGVAADPSLRTSEWLGVAGGGSRRGPVGEPRSLGAKSPVAVEMDRPIVYPNPLGGDDLRVRFYSSGDGDAQFALYNLEGEEVTRATIAVTAESINEHTVDVTGLASGLYVCRLQWDAPGGRETRTMTLAVEK